MCFDSLLNARGIADKEVWVFHNQRRDTGVDTRPVADIIYNYSYKFPHFRTWYHNFHDGAVPGWMWSQYAAFAKAYDFAAPYVYFLSDDNVVTPDFFEWHEAVQADGDWFGSTAWRTVYCNKPFDLAAYYQIQFPNEISHGFCISHKNLEIMLKSCPDWCPQGRMMSEKWKIVMPYVPRVYHIGKFSSHLGSVGANTGPSIDELPCPIPDYGKQTVVLK